MDPKLYEAAVVSNIQDLRDHKDQLSVQLTANKSTVLHVAAQFHDNIECVKVILNLQPSLLCQVNSKRETALHIAARNGHSNTVRMLIQRTKPILAGLKSLEYLNFVLYSSVFGSADVYFSIMMWPRVQIDREKMISMRNKHGDTALHEAVRNNHLDVVKMLVSENAVFPHVVNDFGESPLYIAAKKDPHSHAIVSTILEDCESPAHSGPDGTTALHAAVIAGCPECTKKILEKKPKLVNKADLDGWTPLHYASREGHTDIMKEILSHSPDCWEIVNGKGQNILHIAKEHGKEGVIKFIGSRSVENNNIENQMDNEGNTSFILPLIRDVKNSWLSNLENQMDNNGNTAGSTSIIKGNGPKEGEIMEEPENDDADQQLNPIPGTERKEPKAEDTGNGKEDYNNKREIQLVVAALIATVTFTAGLTLPGGFHSNEGPDQGRAILARIAAFKAFVITNALALTLSVTAIFVYMVSLENSGPEVLGLQLFSGKSLTTYAMLAMMIAFMSGSHAVLSNSSDLAVGVLIIGSSLPILLIGHRRFVAAEVRRRRA